MIDFNYYRNKSLSKIIREALTNKKSLLGIAMGLVIFFVAAFEEVSFFLPEYVGGKEYKEFYFPLFCQVELFLFSTFFVFKSLRYNSCLDTKIISILLSLVFLVSIFAIVFKFSPENYLILAQPVILSATIILILINAVKWFLK